MRLNDEFYFATAAQIYRIMVSPQAKKKPLTLFGPSESSAFGFQR
jgi:hypothetical protein